MVSEGVVRRALQRRINSGDYFQIKDFEEEIKHNLGRGQFEKARENVQEILFLLRAYDLNARLLRDYGLLLLKMVRSEMEKSHFTEGLSMSTILVL